jgi:hypothetical protein
MMYFFRFFCGSRLMSMRLQLSAIGYLLRASKGRVVPWGDWN